MSILRDISRRRLRSGLTIAGVAIGVFALVVLGAMAEKANVTMETSADYYLDKVTVVEAGNANTLGYSNGNRPLAIGKIEQLRAHAGVLDAVPQVAVPLDESALPMGVPALAVGGFLGTDRYPERWKAVQGRLFSESERGVALVGPDLVKQLDAKVGGTVLVRGKRYEVVGILARSYTMIDQAVMVPLADAQSIAADALPLPFRKAVKPGDLALQATVYVRPGEDADKVAAALGRDIPGIKATGPTELRKQLGQIVAVFDAILVSVASIALIVGGLSVLNTMSMSIGERGREIGLKRALGASRRRVACGVVGESSVLGALGGLAGLAFGVLVANALNVAGSATTGTAVFLVTWRLAFGSVAFSAFLGAIAGVYPGWRVSRMDPAAALASR